MSTFYKGYSNLVWWFSLWISHVVLLPSMEAEQRNVRDKLRFWWSSICQLSALKVKVPLGQAKAEQVFSHKSSSWNRFHTWSTSSCLCWASDHVLATRLHFSECKKLLLRSSIRPCYSFGFMQLTGSRLFNVYLCLLHKNFHELGCPPKPAS